MQHFVDGFVAQYRTSSPRGAGASQWNPPADRRPLIEELKWPADLGPCEIRIITVPRSSMQAYGDNLPLFR
jgi:hypothetical protein